MGVAHRNHSISVKQHRKLTMPQPERINVMTSTPHPYFREWFRWSCFRALFVIFTLLILFAHFANNGFRMIAIVLIISFLISILFTASYLLYKLYHIDCPSCHTLMKTIKNKKMSKYEAVCDRCKIIWDIGIDFSDDF